MVCELYFRKIVLKSKKKIVKMVNFTLSKKITICLTIFEKDIMEEREERLEFKYVNV